MNKAVMLTSGASGRVNALFSMRVLRRLLTLINALVMLLLLPFRGRKRCSVSTSPSDKIRIPASVQWKSSAAAAVAVDQEVAARRAIAIRRVMMQTAQPKHENDNEATSLREFSLFATSSGDKMFTQSWSPVSKEIR